MGLRHGEVWILGLTILAPFFLSLKVTDEVYIFGLLVILTAMFKLSWSIKSYIWPQEEKSRKRDQSPLCKLLTPQYSPVSKLIIGYLNIPDVVAASQAYKPWSDEIWRNSQFKIDRLVDGDSDLFECCDIVLPHKHKVTPLQKAIMLGDKITSQELIQRGANLNVRLDKGTFDFGDDSDSCLSEGFTMAHLCALVKDLDTARLLLKEGCNFDESASGFNGPHGWCPGPTPLHVATRSMDSSLDFVKFLVEEAKVGIDVREHGSTSTWDGVTATDMAFDQQNVVFPTVATGFRGVFYYLRSRGGVTTWEFLRDWMKLEKCCTLM